MDLSGDAKTLWNAAVALARATRPVSPSGSPARDLPPMLFFTDPVRTPEPWRTAAALPEGAAVVYRSFGAPNAVAVGRRLRAVTADRGVRLLVGLDADLAERIEADGVHLPERAADQATALRARRPDWLLTAARHAVGGPAPEGLNALVLSPIFPAGGASSVKPALGIEAIEATVQSSGLPVYALGGVGLETVSRLAGSGACGFAGVEAIERAFAVGA